MRTTLYALAAAMFSVLVAVNMARGAYGFAVATALIAASYVALAVLSDRQQNRTTEPPKEEENIIYGTDWRAAAESDRDPAEAADTSARTAPAVADRPAHPDLTITGAGEESGVIIGEVRAYRAWMLLGPYIASGMGEIWMPGSPIHGAGCEIDSTCGVHAFKRYADAAEYFQHTRASTYIVGIVRLWGTVVEHRTGYRGEFGAPDQFLTVVNGDADRLLECANLYGVN